MGEVYSTRGTSELQMNESEEYDKKPWHSYKESNKGVGEQNNAHECDVSEDESRDLEAHDGGHMGRWCGELRACEVT